jgi:DNA-binding transcriptional MerR regulator
VAERRYLSIGEVLSLLQDEFPDVTISKIRFLESQGLLDPERTPSGYRKFYEGDVDRLRWILQQQREHFLPLKVIKGRLAGDETEGAAVGTNGGGGTSHEVEVAAAGSPERPSKTGSRSRRPAGAASGETARLFDAGPDPLDSGPSSANLTIEELAAASGLPPERLAELERYGMIAGRPVAGTVYYDEEALVVASAAASFARFGVEARHLKTYKNFAEREAGLFEQIVLPLVKQRNPESRRQAVETLSELSRLGQSLRASMLRQALRDHTGSR